MHRKEPPRLAQVFQAYRQPVYFVTLCTMRRTQVLANPTVHDAFRTYAVRGRSEKGVGVGRYVIMPDHIHLFVRIPDGVRLSPWVGGLKRAISVVARHTGKSLWQPGFFDHLLRRNESYREKWQYVVQNPVRRALVTTSELWPYQGEVVAIDRA